ncbi:MAG: AMP-binding protein [Acidimicrobiia bacterium]|nr:AMP-binding protein [Acidimicrobiia bacterium]
MSLARRIEEVVARVPDKVALRTEDRELTFAELDELASRAAGGLRALGVGPGDRVAIMAGSHPEFVASVVGTWKLGAIVVAVNAQLGPEEVLYQLRSSGARVVLADPGRSREVIDEVAASAPDLAHVVSIGEPSGEPVRAVDLDPGADATIFYTSGTTGLPKGATHTHRALLVQLDMVREHYRVTEDDVFLSVLPIYLLSILILGPLSSLLAGSTCRLLSKYDPSTFATFVREDRTTMIGASIPMMFSDLLDLPPEEAERVDLSSIRVASCGGSPMPPEIRKAFEERYDFRFIHAYGGTEGPAMVSTDPFDRPRKFDSVGVPMAHIKVTIVDDQDRDVPVGEIGEICTGPYEEGPYAGLYEPIRCYWGMPEESEEALRGGRLHWGDIGYFDEDGFLYLVDRKKDMIIRGGMNVYPKELEALLYEDDRIAECAVVGAMHPRYGEIPFAFVRPAPGAELTEDDVKAIVNERTARFKHLEGVRFVEEFPRNALGKILKRELRSGLEL